jgi:hypothetical protein
MVKPGSSGKKRRFCQNFGNPKVNPIMIPNGPWVPPPAVPPEPGRGPTPRRYAAPVTETHDLRLVADEASPPISLERWQAVKSHLLEIQPARRVSLEGDPPRAIRVESYAGIEVAPALLASVEQLTGTTLHVEPVSLRDLRAGFRDERQRRRVQTMIEERIADDRDQDECRYLMRFLWQLSMTNDEVTMPELREHVDEAKLRVISELIRAIRLSPDSIDAWIQTAADAWPCIHDRGFQQWQADD